SREFYLISSVVDKRIHRSETENLIIQSVRCLLVITVTKAFVSSHRDDVSVNQSLQLK
ncbi:hypothetical protein J6590_068521, partial [Homalodisca vitripennis]